MIEFTILGNPIPYLRMTQGQVKLMSIPDHKLSREHFKKKKTIRRYLNWKDYVRFNAVKLNFDRAPKIKVYLDVMIFYQNKKHADPENIRKGIQDALFENDKYVAGKVDFDYDAENPRCEIKIKEVMK